MSDGTPTRRRRLTTTHKRLLGGAGSIAVVADRLVEFLARYVTEPADPEAAVEAIWEMSEDQFNSALGHLTAGSQTPPKVSGQ